MTDLFDAACVAAGISPPEREFRFHPVRKWRFDFAWIVERIALECDGGLWVKGRHVRATGFLGDIEKLNEAQILGWAVLRCTPKEFNNGEALNLVLRCIENSKVTP